MEAKKLNGKLIRGYTSVPRDDCSNGIKREKVNVVGPFGGVVSLAVVFPFVGDCGFAIGAVADMIVFMPPLLLLVFLYKMGKKWLAKRKLKATSYVRTFEVEISERESTLAAMSIAQEEGKDLSVEGGKEFKEMCVELAAENDLKLDDPNLQERVEKMKASLPYRKESHRESN